MFIFTARFSKKKAILAIIALGAALCVAIALVGALRRGSGGQPQDASGAGSSSGRLAYLQSFGWNVGAEPVETLDLMLPDALDESYAEYNDMQKKQGLDLSSACGKHVTRYTYSVANYPGIPDGVQADIYVCGGAVVAGDIISSGEGGFIAGLAFPK